MKAKRIAPGEHAQEALPIDSVLDEFVTSLQQSRTLILEADPGAGKTTRAPLALLSLWEHPKEVLVAEPRRIAARAAAERVAAELGEPVGETVGYSVRFEHVVGPRTRVRYVTYGLLLRELAQGKSLSTCGAVVLDEFHERALAMDVCLARLLELQRQELPQLRLVVMSATLEGQRLLEFIDGSRHLKSEGRAHPVKLHHLEGPDDRPLEKQVASAVREALGAAPSGDVLVFLPGAREIRRTQLALESLAQAGNLSVHALHGDLPLKEQAKIMQKGSGRRIILATNIAEASVTVPGVNYVIDAGWVRQSEHSVHTGVSQLTLVKTSKASARQRAGRAGRTEPGTVRRLYTRSDFELRPDYDTPEVLRSDLSEVWLLLKAMGVKEPARLAWLDPPRPKAQQQAEELLRRLQALDTNGSITQIGQRLLRFPVHPRLGRVLVEAERVGVAPEACTWVALLSERDIRQRRSEGMMTAPPHLEPGPSDLLDLWERFEAARRASFDSSEIRYQELEPRAVDTVNKARGKLLALCEKQHGDPKGRSQAELEKALLRLLLVGFSDRVARRKSKDSPGLILVDGMVAELSESSVVTQAPLLLALDLEERREPGRAPKSVVRLASAIEAEWLLEDFYSELTFDEEIVLDEKRGRAEVISQVRYGSIVLDETRGKPVPGPNLAQVLWGHAVKQGPWLGKAREAWTQLATKSEVVARAGKRSAEAGATPALGFTSPEELLKEACSRVSTLEELESINFQSLAEEGLPADVRTLWARLAPDRIQLPSGRQLVVHYEPGKEPWVESRLQDFFGMRTGPTIAGGVVPLTLHLLAPNKRPVQVTTDLAGFWTRHYPAIRKELMRRYPRHAWPEDPTRPGG